MNDIKGLQKTGINYEIDQLKNKLAQGEDVESKLLAKIKERTAFELEQIRLTQAEYEAQGMPREAIEEAIRLKKAGIYRDEKAALDDILSRINRNKTAEMGQPIKGVEGLADYQANLFGERGGMAVQVCLPTA